MYILGISAYYHDSAACLLRDGAIIGAAQEERFTRKKHDFDFPINSIKFCLSQAQIGPEKIDLVVFYDKPFLKFERLLETYLALAPRGLASFITSMPIWCRDKIFQKSKIRNSLISYFGASINWDEKLLFSEHHLSHAASAFFPSPFDEAAILTMDGVGEWATTSLGIGRGNEIEIHKEIKFPHSIGLLYSAFTYYLGFKVNSGEYKVMGLAPYGEPRYASLIMDQIIDIKEDGSFFLDMSFFDYCAGLTMTSQKFHKLFEAPPRNADDLITQREMDLAASIQAVTEEVLLKLAHSISRETGQKNLCLAGGVALNCVANGKLFRENIFQNIWIQPAAGDAGGALGAAFVAHHMYLNSPRVTGGSSDCMLGSYLGPEYSQGDIEERLHSIGACFTVHEADEVLRITASALSEGNAVGWHQGRMEFGPRSLGSRSILADPRSPEMQKQLNLKVKFRESFRPFAPSVLREDASEWFDFHGDSPYMLLVANIAESKKLPILEGESTLFGLEKLKVPRSIISAVTHVDSSARIQTVHKNTNPVYWALIEEFKRLTGCPVLVNTSFNVRGEPIVCTPEDSFHCFMGTGLDLLVVGNCVLWKSGQDGKLLNDYRHKFELD